MAKKKKVYKNVKSKPKMSKPEEKLNPFELKFNRKKHDIIGQKLKTHQGTITKNKLQINEKRKEFLKKVQLHRTKANGFIDKRIGEYDSDMLKEDKVMARIAANQRKRQKKNLYNLNDEFDLTHGGIPISNLETFEDNVADSEDEEDNQLDADFVSEAHFGGFLTKKEDSAPKTRKEILNEFITESKKKKQERKDAKELTDDLTTKLDEEWKQLYTYVPDIKTDNTKKKSPADSYDLTVKQFIFEPRGTPVFHAKNEELEKQKQLEKLEQERLSRMVGNTSKKKQLPDFSADALDENFDLSSESIEADYGDQNSDENSVKVNEDEEDKTDSSSSDSELEEEDKGDSDEKDNDKDIAADNALIPQSIVNFENVTSNLTLEDFILKLDSIIAHCQFKTETEIFKYSLAFFKVLLTYINMKFSNNCQDQKLLDGLMTRTLILAHKSSFETGKIVRSFLLEKIKAYKTLADKRQFRFFNILILLKLCKHLYSTSDYKHPVITPAMILMSHMLTSTFKVTVSSVVCRTFVCYLFYDYVALSKRYVPEAVNYLLSVLILASLSESPHFEIIKKLKLNIPETKKILRISLKSDNWDPNEFSELFFMHNLLKKNDTEKILSIIHFVITLLYKFAQLYEHLDIFPTLFQPASELMSCLPIKYYPNAIVDKIQELQNFVLKKRNPIKHLTYPHQKPKMLKLFTPRFDDEFSEKKPSETLGIIKQHKELQKKIKKEEKGVIREIRRDAEFEAREKLKAIIEADNERKRKVKELYADLANQEGEYKKFTKKKF